MICLFKKLCNFVKNLLSAKWSIGYNEKHLKSVGHMIRKRFCKKLHHFISWLSQTIHTVEGGVSKRGPQGCKALLLDMNHVVYWAKAHSNNENLHKAQKYRVTPSKNNWKNVKSYFTKDAFFISIQKMSDNFD